jgi:hypothetical protein
MKTRPTRAANYVAQIVNLLCRRMEFGRAWKFPGRSGEASRPQIANLRHSRVPLCATSNLPGGPL